MLVGLTQKPMSCGLVLRMVLYERYFIVRRAIWQRKELFMTSFGSTLTKTAFFAIGALAGALLTEWLDKLLATRAQVQSEYDSSYYAQGLQPCSRLPVGESDRKES